MLYFILAVLGVALYVTSKRSGTNAVEVVAKVFVGIIFLVLLSSIYWTYLA